MLCLATLPWAFFAAAVVALSPSGGYAPGAIECPSGSLLREGSLISSRESAWVQKREEYAKTSLEEFLSANLEETDISNVSVRLATAFSGGGYRAMFVGAGELAAIDSRSEGALDLPVLGLLQASTYVAGLSGGAWLVGSVAIQDWPTVDSLLDPGANSTLWNMATGNSLVDYLNIFGLVWAVLINSYSKLITHVRWWNTPSGEGIKSNLADKEDAGFPTTITDVWGRDLAHQLFPSLENYFEPLVWLDIAKMPAFLNHTMPFPLVTALARRPDSLVYDLNSPIVEFNPYETGSFDSSINSFFLTKYLGTNPNSTSSSNSSSTSTYSNSSSSCIAGYDNAAFVVGTSSSLFNQFLDTLVCPDCDSLPSIAKWLVKRLLKRMLSQKEDIAIIKPNPFYGSEYAASDNISTSELLYLMDGGIAGEYIPLSTLMTTHRELDVVLAFDNNPADWPDGLSLINAYRRADLYEGKDTVCPYVPGEDTFYAFNLTAKPVFFGCDASNQTDRMKDGVVPPLVIYLANRPFEYYSNQLTLKLTYTDSEKKATVQNGFDIASQMNGTVDSNWGTCVACALIRRDQERNNVTQSDECKACFEQYCWDGSVYEGELPYYPPVNFTLTGLTNDSMSLWGNNSIVVSSSSSGSFSIWSLLWTGIKSLFSWL